MRESWNIRNVPAKTRLKLNLLAASRRIPVANLLKELTDQAWEEDNPQVDGRSVKNIKRCIN
ncbi:MAG: hypothetical protein ACXABY_28680, partial [Candidatus Thorarchaeota archaeon]